MKSRAIPKIPAKGKLAVRSRNFTAGGSVEHGPAGPRPRPIHSTSPMEVELFNPIESPSWAWDGLVMTHPECTIFHGAAWARVLSKTYGHTPVYLRFSEHGETAALIPIMEVRSPITGTRGVCLPFSDFCGPLLFDGFDHRHVFHQLSELARQRDWKHLEIRGTRAPFPIGGQSQAYYGHRLILSDSSEALLDRFKDSTRRAIRKAERSGLRVRITQSEKAILDFYKLHVRTRQRHGLPPQPFSFFQNFFREVIQTGLGFVVLAKDEGRTAAAAVFLRFGDTAMYKFGASEELLWESRPNNLVMWEGIRFLARLGVRTLHFGRTSPEHDGLRRFKRSWGADEEKIAYLRFDTRAAAWVPVPIGSSGFHNLVFGRLPLAVNRFAGALIYPHLD